ncbi:hypothetical protein AB0K60_11890 [Thermopolyspora sp. NPDC052614]|uniref:hypothetical protein n=1 Tax=Thermopolyspora sp. NPDC052614 TaxID=3155682 RepID=UPI00343C1CC4
MGPRQAVRHPRFHRGGHGPARTRERHRPLHRRGRGLDEADFARLQELPRTVTDSATAYATVYAAAYSATNTDR